jgi:hypothetical protein
METERSDDVDSLDTRVSLEESTETAKVGSIDTRADAMETERSDDVDSLDARVSLEESTETAKVASIDTRTTAMETERSSDIASIDSRLSIEENTTQVSLDIPVTGGSTHIDVGFGGKNFGTNDIKVFGALRDKKDNENNPIIFAQLSGDPSTNNNNEVTFIFSDEVPTANGQDAAHSDNSAYVLDCIFTKENQNN